MSVMCVKYEDWDVSINMCCVLWLQRGKNSGVLRRTDRLGMPLDRRGALQLAVLILAVPTQYFVMRFFSTNEVQRDLALTKWVLFGLYCVAIIVLFIKAGSHQKIMQRIMHVGWCRPPPILETDTCRGRTGNSCAPSSCLMSAFSTCTVAILIKVNLLPLKCFNFAKEMATLQVSLYRN